MFEITKYNSVRKEMESRFSGLPHAHTTLIKSLLSYADPETGLVQDISCRDLANLLSIEPTPGRKGAGTPKIETIRSYLRTIADNCATDFKLVSQGQKLKLQFLKLPEVYNYFFGQEKPYVDQKEVCPSTYLIENKLENKGIDRSHALDRAQEWPEQKEEKKPLKNINNKTNKHNKKTGEEVFENESKIISPNFYPTPETIAIALGRGFFKVTNHDEIQKFIKYNQANESKWVDFNPVFLCWLERDSEYQQIKQQQKSRTQNIIRSSNHERSPHKNNSYAAVMEAVLNDNRNACAPSGLYPSKGLESDSSTYCLAVDSANEHLRATIHQ